MRVSEERLLKFEAGPASAEITIRDGRFQAGWIRLAVQGRGTNQLLIHGVEEISALALLAAEIEGALTTAAPRE